MNARRLLLVLGSAVVIVSLMLAYLGHEEQRRSYRPPRPSPEADPTTAPDAEPGEVLWSSWHDEIFEPEEPEGPVVADVHGREMRFEDLPDRVRERLERDYQGLDVVLPPRDR